MPPSYIRVRAVVWAYGRGQTDTQTHTHTQTDTQTRVTTIHFASSTTHAKCNKNNNDSCTHTALFQDYSGEPEPEEIFFWTLWCKGRYQRHTQTIWLGATPSRLISDTPPSFPHFYADALPDATLSIYPGLGQAPNMLACIPSGLVMVISDSY